MGIYDREYIRMGPRSKSGLGRMGALSVNSWIIIINVVVHLLANTAFPILYDIGYFSTAKALFYIHNAKTILSLEVWRFVTFQFLHAPGIMHIFFNMFGLYVFGGLVEEYLGRKRYAAFYLVCGIFGGLAYVLLNLLESVFHLPIPGDFGDPTTPLVGASAGVFGVIMASAFIAPNAIVQLIFPPIPLKLKWFAYGYVAVAAFVVITGGKNAGGQAAHLGGAFAGYFFIRNAHLLRDFFDVFSDSRHPQPGGGGAERRAAPSQDEVDRILSKVGTQGIHSLSEAERRTLRRATESTRRRR